MSVLNNAIAKGNLELVKNLIEVQGYSPDYTGFWGIINIYPSPIYTATEYNQVEIVEYLIQKGADVNFSGSATKSPIDMADDAFSIMNPDPNSIKILSTLLVNNANLPSYMNKTSFIKKYIFSAIKADDASSVEKLLTYSKADINTTELNYASSGKMTLLDKAIMYDATEVATKLITMGADVNHLDGNLTPLLWSIKNGNTELIELLLENGANVDLAGPENRTPLMLASTYSDPKHDRIVDLLVKHGADVNQADQKGFTALDYAAKSGNLNAVNILIEAGADLHHQNNEGQTAADIVLDQNHVAILNTLYLHGAEIPKIMGCQTNAMKPIEINEVLSLGNNTVMSDIISEQANVTEPSNNNNTSDYVQPVATTLPVMETEASVVAFG